MPIADTSFVIDLMRRDQGAISLYEEYEQRGIALQTTGITALELYKGAFISGTAQNRLKVAALLELFTALPIRSVWQDLIGTCTAWRCNRRFWRGYRNPGPPDRWRDHYPGPAFLKNPSSENHFILTRKPRQWSHDALVRLTLPDDANIYASQYQLYLPSKEELKRKLIEWSESAPDTPDAG